MEVHFEGQSYKEYLQEVRNKQFGWGEEKIEFIDEVPSVTVPKKRGKGNGKV